MNTFLEFYMALVQFINFKIFNELGFSQPPVTQELLDPVEIK
jgi:pescadillo protein